jgi:hypothetical protein
MDCTSCHLSRLDHHKGDHISKLNLPGHYILCPLESNNAKSTSQALFDLKLQLTPLLGNSQHSTLPKTSPIVIGCIDEADLYRTAPLCIQRSHIPDSQPVGSLNIFQCTQTLLLQLPIMGNPNSLTKGTKGTTHQNGLLLDPYPIHFIIPPFPPHRATSLQPPQTFIMGDSTLLPFQSLVYQDSTQILLQE